MDLHASIRDAETKLRAGYLCHIAFVARSDAAIRARRELINQELRHVMLHVAVGQHELHRLAFRERSAKRDPLLGIACSDVETTFGDAKATASLIEPSTCDPGLSGLHPVALLSDQVFRGHLHIIECNLIWLV